MAAEAGQNNVVDFGQFRAAREAAARARRAARSGVPKYVLYYPSAGMALLVQPAAVKPVSVLSRHNGFISIPEGA